MIIKNQKSKSKTKKFFKNMLNKRVRQYPYQYTIQGNNYKNYYIVTYDTRERTIYVFSIINDNIFTLYNLYIVAIFRELQM